MVIAARCSVVSRAVFAAVVLSATRSVGKTAGTKKTNKCLFCKVHCIAYSRVLHINGFIGGTGLNTPY